MTRSLPSTQTQSKLGNISSTDLVSVENPHDALILSSDDRHEEVQHRYAAHCNDRNAQQRAKFLSSDFSGLIIDQHLLKLERPHLCPGFRDERGFRICSKLLPLVCQIPPKPFGTVAKSDKLTLLAVWLMPTYRIHLTTQEIAFCKTPDEIASLVSTLRPSLPAITSYTTTHRARLVKPMISYDLSAFAVSFLPASGEAALSPASTKPSPQHCVEQCDSYTYQHLRRDILDQVSRAGLKVETRYQVPSAHITLGRYLSDEDHDTPEKTVIWVEAIEAINKWLEEEVWDRPDADFVGEWIVGQEQGLDARTGTVWYGGGRTIMMGEGF
ncbi:ureidoglycolate hydrolase [Fusarium albosuccineum]|uniref:Ureidoglycolate hydrolase n=1 Tax=Fusarium albosuccineum TaxID=1237068 RepID=A0A8H4LLT9_9HYPO|nr:ureidoglycolate hydrolase [Fusarium albosuccineum]